jgi:hypothetical protein
LRERSSTRRKSCCSGAQFFRVERLLRSPRQTGVAQSSWRFPFDRTGECQNLRSRLPDRPLGPALLAQRTTFLARGRKNDAPAFGLPDYRMGIPAPRGNGVSKRWNQSFGSVAMCWRRDLDGRSQHLAHGPREQGPRLPGQGGLAGRARWSKRAKSCRSRINQLSRAGIPRHIHQGRAI